MSPTPVCGTHHSIRRPAEKRKQLPVKPSGYTNASDTTRRSTPFVLLGCCSWPDAEPIFRDVVVSDHSGTTVESGAISRKESIGFSSPDSVRREPSKDDSPSGDVEGSVGAPYAASKT